MTASNQQSTDFVTGCCLICDRISVDSKTEPVHIANACPVCEQDIRSFLNHPLADQSNIREDIDAAAEILANSRFPLICGLTDQSMETQRAAIALAKVSNAVIDWTNGNAPAAFHAALQDCGLVSCTFEEIRERADLVVFFACCPTQINSRFLNRFVDGTPNLTIDWDRQRQLAALRFLRQGGETRHHDTAELADDAEFMEFKMRLDKARYPVFVVTDELATKLGDTGVLGLMRLVRQQNDKNHCRLVHIPGTINSTGIKTSLTAIAGAPFGVAYRDDVASFRGREFGVDSLLKKQWPDSILLVGSPEQLPAGSDSFAAPRIWVSDNGRDDWSSNVRIAVPPLGPWMRGNGTARGWRAGHSPSTVSH